MNRRHALICLCSFGVSGISRATPPTSKALDAIPLKQHELAMRAAIAMAALNPVYPFGAVIINANNGAILAKGVNTTFNNPTFHGEIACINDYVSKHGNKHWADLILYTTGEPCPMCMSALIWAGIRGVVFGSSIATIKRSGIDAFIFSANDINKGGNFSQTQILGGILEPECDELFINRKRA
jgi:tRNA(adenine34) deaminase